MSEKQLEKEFEGIALGLMSKRPLPLIPGQSDPDEDPPDHVHTADDPMTTRSLS